MDLTLLRDVAQPGYTYGTLIIPAAFVLQTLELGWAPEPDAACGRPDRSCVPVGVYQLALHDTPKHPKTWALVNRALGIYHEPGDAPSGGALCRFACLLHVANYPSELEGCVGVGLTRAPVGPAPAIWKSASAMAQLQEALSWVEGHTLTISYVTGVTPS